MLEPVEVDPARDWSARFRADVCRFFGVRADAVVLRVDPEVQVYDLDEPCETCRMSWFAVEVEFRLPNGGAVTETHRGGLAAFLAAVTVYAQEYPETGGAR